MIKKANIVIFILLALSNIIAFSQNNTSSPYSRYGLGELNYFNNGQTSGLGGATIGWRDPNNLNLSNPAAITDLDTTGQIGSPFLFEFGLKNKNTFFKTETEKFYDYTTNLNYISLGFPVLKNYLFAALYLNPYSNTGYSIVTTENNTDLGEINSYYIGYGGINRSGGTISAKPFPFLSVGVNIFYIFGQLNQTNTMIFNDDEASFNYQIEKTTRISDVQYNFGLQAHKKIIKNEHFHQFTIGAVYTNYNDVAAKRNVFAGTTLGTNTTSIYDNVLVDTIINVTEQEGKIRIPSNYGVGVSYNYDNKIKVSADYYQQNWSQSEFFGVVDTLADSKKVSAGLEYTPDYYNKSTGFINTLKRTNYRFGFYYTKTYLNFVQKNTQLNDFGITFGLGLPVLSRDSYGIKNYKTRFNIFAKLGQLGTVEQGLIQETYVVIGLNISYFDNWFVKRKYD
ncbi:MAG: membrane protein [Marinilabiliales bacterium]